MEQTETIQSKEVEVKGFRYLINHQNPEAAWDIGIELTKLIGEPMSSMATAGNDSNAGAALSMAVKVLLSKVDSKSSWSLMKRILSSVECQGPSHGQNKKILMTDIGIKSHFHGRTGAMLTLAGEVVSFTHEDFFDAIADGIATMMKKTSEKASQ